jgi:hypothetical protein
LSRRKRTITKSKFDTITGADWYRELKRARKEPNEAWLTIKAKLDELTELKKSSIIHEQMSNITKYLPERSENSVKVAEALKPYENVLYVVGSNARKALYGLNTDVKDYDFVLSTGCGCPKGELANVLQDILTGAFPDAVQEHDAYFVVDCEAFTLKIRLEPIDQFLYSVRFAGDGLAVRVSDGRPLVLPEYMTLPPVVQIIEDEKVGDQKGEWLENHVKALEEFQKALFDLVQKQIGNEPAKS